MLSILNLTKTNKLILAAFAFVAVLAFGSGRAHAATLNVSGGCTLPIAIDSVNAGANQSGCTASGSYGSSDTISIPAGTITLNTNLPQITEDVTIHGAGMNTTAIDGSSGAYDGIQAVGVAITIQDMKIASYANVAIGLQDCDVTLQNIEVDGSNAGGDTAIVIISTSGDDKSVTTNNLYMHDITHSSTALTAFNIQETGGATLTVNVNNTTLTNIQNTSVSGGDAFGFATQVQGMGIINTTISNTTIHNIKATSVAAAFVGLSIASGSDAAVNMTVSNATITGTRGITSTLFPVAGAKSAAFYSAAFGQTSGDTASVTINVSNSLFADNLSGSDSSNCSTIDITPNAGGSGTGTPTITSLGNNISDDASCTSFTQTGDQQNVSNIISTLGPLQNNGGNVPTRALLAGSPAIAAGSAVLGVTTDARGIARPDSCPSVGAYQFEGAVCGASTPSTSGGNAGAPNTGIGSTTQILNVLVGLLGLGLLTYVFRKQQRTS